MGAMPKRGPIYPIFELDMPADKRQLYAKFQHPISIPAEDSVITTDGRTDMARSSYNFTLIKNI